MTSHRSFVVAMLAIIAAAPPAFAVDQLLLGTRLVLKDARRDHLLFLTRDGAIAVGNGADAPTAAGMRLQILNPVQGTSGTIDMPARLWTVNRFGTNFRYRDRRGEAGPVRTAILRNGRLLKIVARSTGIPLTAPSQGSLAVVVTSGAQRYCVLFATTSIRRDVSGKFLAKKSARPLECPPGAIGSPSGAFVAP